jgi:hypothetical protein
MAFLRPISVILIIQKATSVFPGVKKRLKKAATKRSITIPLSPLTIKEKGTLDAMITRISKIVIKIMATGLSAINIAIM